MRILAALALLAACAPAPLIEAPIEAPAGRRLPPPFLAVIEIDAGGLEHDVTAATRVATCSAACLKLAIEGASVEPECDELCAGGHMIDPECILRAATHWEYPSCALP